MAKGVPVEKIFTWLRLFTYISATVLLIAGNNFDQLTYLIPLVLILVFVNYSREYYLIANTKPIPAIVASIVLEMLLIISIGFLDKTDVNILFFFVCVSSSIIVYPFIYSIPLAVAFIASGLWVYAQRHGSVQLTASLIPMLFSYGVSTVFVMGMSYFVKRQLREREKLARLNAELEQAYEKLIESSATAQKLSVEQERTRMAREIHDTLAHTLTTLIVQLEACKRLAALDPSRLPGELEKAQELSRSGFNDVKRSIKALRPQAMEDRSLIASITAVINETMANTKVHITFHNQLADETKLGSQVEIALFRVIQESITNSIRHGHADNIEINLKQADGRLQLQIVDNGVGCTNIKKGYGMQGIGERIANLHGSAEFSSSSNQGFATRISIPHEVA